MSILVTGGTGYIGSHTVVELIKAGKKAEQIDCIYAGDLLNQCIASSFGLREMNIPFVGMVISPASL